MGVFLHWTGLDYWNGFQWMVIEVFYIEMLYMHVHANLFLLITIIGLIQIL